MGGCWAAGSCGLLGVKNAPSERPCLPMPCATREGPLVCARHVIRIEQNKPLALRVRACEQRHPQPCGSCLSAPCWRAHCRQACAATASTPWSAESPAPEPAPGWHGAPWSGCVPTHPWTTQDTRPASCAVCFNRLTYRLLWPPTPAGPARAGVHPGGGVLPVPVAGGHGRVRRPGGQEGAGARPPLAGTHHRLHLVSPLLLPR